MENSNGKDVFGDKTHEWKMGVGSNDKHLTSPESPDVSWSVGNVDNFHFHFLAFSDNWAFDEWNGLMQTSK